MADRRVLVRANTPWYDKPLIFQKWDQELRRYEPQYFLDRPWALLSPVNPFEWHYDHEVDANRMELRIKTADSGVFVFDITTGAVVSSNRAPLIAQKGSFLERGLATKISQAFDIFVGSRDWKEAPHYIAESVFIQCSHFQTRNEMEESIQMAEDQFGDRVGHLLQLFDIRAAKLPLRGVTRLEHDDARFDLYRLPYGQAGDFLCGNPELVEQPGEWRERAAYASISEIKVNPSRLELAIGFGLVKADWAADLPADYGLIAIWMQDPDWRIIGLITRRIRFPNGPVK